MASDDEFVKRIAEKQLGRSPSGIDTSKGEPMSKNPKDMIRGKPVVTQRVGNSITELKKQQKDWAEWKLRNGKQGYAAEEIKAEGEKLKLDEDLIKQRNLNDDKLLKQMVKEDKTSAKGVAHFTTGQTVELQKPEDTDSLKGNEEGKEIKSRFVKG
jgi:hypothetical protein